MTSAGILEELEDHDQAAVREYICQNAGGIFKYANSIRPIGDDEALYIITGSIKSESWALAAFNHPQPHFSPRLIRQTSSFVWRSPGTFNAYSGKSVTPGSRDQTLFLRGKEVRGSAAGYARRQCVLSRWTITPDVEYLAVTTSHRVYPDISWYYANSGTGWISGSRFPARQTIS